MSKIMIIEDDKVVSKELATLLELSGYTAEILCDFENSSHFERIERRDKNTFRLPRQHLPFPDGRINI